jgi:hypothetical protein
MNIGYLYDDDIKQIDKVEFNILKNSEIKDISVIKDTNGIVTPDLHENAAPGLVNQAIFYYSKVNLIYK